MTQLLLPTVDSSISDVPSQDIKIMNGDTERLFDTLVALIRHDKDKRRELSRKSLDAHRTKGKGMFVVNAVRDDDSRVIDDVEELFRGLEWWNHEDCTRNMLPNYCPDDPGYDPEIQDYMRNRNDIGHHVMLGMYWSYSPRGSGILHRDATFTTLSHPNVWGLYNAENPSNPYQDVHNVGEEIIVHGHQCAASGCDNLEATQRLPCPSSCPTGECEHVAVLSSGRALMKCAGCHQVVYCSKACQKKHWREGHRQECQNLRLSQ
uniref:MYND-type domain-containing protein n=1 Tax=Entomoneis paludosa TaxID=265537 RepID=A0A7S2Y7A5_9STRA|eukprot:CAMPEP_0172449138 /NCGR_PEP_ID=MMETSP1065-20121228/7922_1 /TAXON_ID=265537 /ORGANISM="Amphiprora paludosa, Strain CCMP125" /LENGTH=262 /DNA_ID=CAMNT_0013200741 /DNA_START=26 /DNA_END=814 /DNA_ORIENTATION=-